MEKKMVITVIQPTINMMLKQDLVYQKIMLNIGLKKMFQGKKIGAHSDEHKRKIGGANKGKPKPKLECPYCGKTGGAPQMKQWHFDNCKAK